MNKGIGYAVATLCGAIIGGTAVHFFEQKKCDIRVQEAEARATQFYMQKLQEICYDELPNEDEAETEKPSDVVQKCYESAVTTLGYAEEDKTVMQGIYTMEDPDEFTHTSRESVMIDHFSDGVFVDADDNVLNDKDMYAYFGVLNIEKMLDESEDGVLYITNEKLEMDFEISDHPVTWASIKQNRMMNDE